jgi:hypothetical protein
MDPRESRKIGYSRTMDQGDNVFPRLFNLSPILDSTSLLISSSCRPRSARVGAAVRRPWVSTTISIVWLNGNLWCKLLLPAVVDGPLQFPAAVQQQQHEPHQRRCLLHGYRVFSWCRSFRLIRSPRLFVHSRRHARPFRKASILAGLCAAGISSVATTSGTAWKARLGVSAACRPQARDSL